MLSSAAAISLKPASSHDRLATNVFPWKKRGLVVEELLEIGQLEESDVD
jgi:hypothetical protein